MKNVFSRKFSIGIVVLAVTVAWVAPAFASVVEDVQPPPWRGQISTTSQFWLFNTDSTGPLQPDGSLGQPWLPSTHITVEPLGNWIQTDPVSGRYGIWPLAGRMNVTVDNHNPPNDVKYMWVQVIWQDIPGLPTTGPILGGFQPGVYPAGTLPEAVGPVDLGLGWFETTYKWEIRPNPRDEFFVLGGNINVDALIIDTWCIPEPSAVLLATLGGGLLLVLRWRRCR